MPIVLKSASEIALMRSSGIVVADVHAAMRSAIAPGISTRELDAIGYAVIDGVGGEPSFLNFRGYPASTCISVNDEVLHGIPGDRILLEGDIVSIDVGVKLNGFHADSAFTVGVGTISTAAQALIDTTEACFWAGYRQVVEGHRLGDVARPVQALAEYSGYGVVREYTGHGVGRKMHEDPSVPNWGKPGTGSLIRRGMTFALEPMITAGAADTRVHPDGWTVTTVDGSLAAHYEHTIAITDDGPKLLTVATGNKGSMV